MEIHFLHVRNWWKDAFLILLGFELNFCWVESHVSHIVGSRLEAHVSDIVGSRVEGHFLVLLGVVGQKIIFLSYCCWRAGGKVTFSYCWELSVIFLKLLGIGGKSVFACWELVESRFSYIVGGWEKISSLACRAQKKDSTRLKNHPTSKL